MSNYKKITLVLSGVVLGTLISGCADIKTEAKYPDRRQGDSDTVYNGERKGIFGQDGIGLFKNSDAAADVSGIAVNSYLWQASLDTISFMPIHSADPFGGMILTDWYQTPDVPNERSKIDILILGRQLRADGVKVSVFRQVKKGSAWQDAVVTPDTATKLEDAILTRARQLHVAAKDN